MKKQIYAFVLMLLPILTLSFQAQAQCPGCVIDMNYIVTPAAPGITPDTLPDGQVGQYYDANVDIYLPAQFTTQGTNVTLTKLEVLSVSGLPFGLNFQSNAPNNTFFPSQNPPTTEHACAKICGTPVFPGQYSMVVFVRAYVNTIIGPQTSDDSFVLPIKILPGGSGNASFSAFNTTGCGQVTATFQTNLPSNGKPGFSYNWNFGNGTTSTLETPPPASYNNPGQYNVTCQTIIDTLPFRYLKTITVTGTSCTDFSGKPDLYIKVSDLSNNAIYQAAAVGNTNPPVTFNLPNVQINHNQSYLVEVWDEDTGIEAPDDNCANFQIMGNTNNVNLTSGSNAISIVIEKALFTYNDTVTVTVFPLPIKPIVTALPDDSVCAGDSILLSTAVGGSIQWFKDTAMLAGATLDTMYVYTSGKYFLVVTDTVNGCQATSDTAFIAVFNNPPKPTFWRQGDTLRTLLAGYNLQWHYNSVPIPGANSQTCHIADTGLYHVIASIPFGCATSSDTVFYQPFNISVPENDLQRGFSLYPNPSKDVINVLFKNPYNNETTLVIFDILNRVVWSELLKNTDETVLKTIDISGFSNGLYFISVINNNVSLCRKFLKQ